MEIQEPEDQKNYTDERRRGVNMTDFTVFDKAIKLCWVKRLCSAEHPVITTIECWWFSPFSLQL